MEGSENARQLKNREESDRPKFDHQVASINGLRSKRSPYIAKWSQYKDCPDVLAFLEEMNKNCARINLKSSFFDSPHGLMNTNSKSTAFDIAKLAALCMEDTRFAKVVGTKYFVVPRKKDVNGNKKTYRWENTHRMIE